MANYLNLAQRFKFVPIGVDVDINAATDNYTDSVNMKNFHRALFIVQYYDLGGANHKVFCFSDPTATPAQTSTLTFRYAFGGAAQGAANCDVLGTEATSSALTVAQATYGNYLLLIEVDAAAMDVANGEEWLCLDFQDTGDAGATGQAIVIAMLEPRYAGVNKTAIV